MFILEVTFHFTELFKFPCLYTEVPGERYIEIERYINIFFTAVCISNFHLRKQSNMNLWKVARHHFLQNAEQKAFIVTIDPTLAGANFQPDFDLIFIASLPSDYFIGTKSRGY